MNATAVSALPRRVLSPLPRVLPPSRTPSPAYSLPHSHDPSALPHALESSIVTADVLLQMPALLQDGVKFAIGGFKKEGSSLTTPIQGDEDQME